jgi:hypothetical protein
VRCAASNAVTSGDSRDNQDPRYAPAVTPSALRQRPIQKLLPSEPTQNSFWAGLQIPLKNCS